MTWVFGSANPLGSAICVADIQVTLADDRTLDCLQKLYVMDQNVLAGFAGDVFTGFAMLANFQRYLQSQDAPLDAEQVVDAFAGLSQAVFAQLPTDAQARGCQVLIAAATRRADRLYGSDASVVRFSWPDFQPERMPRGEWASIGSGAGIAEYRRELEALSGDEARALFVLESSNPGGYAAAMTHIIVDNVSYMPDQPGISKHFHIGTVFANECTITTSDRTIYAEGPPREIRMPQVATSWTELQALLRQELGEAPTAVRA